MEFIDGLSGLQIFGLLWIGGAVLSTLILICLMNGAKSENEFNGHE